MALPTSSEIVALDYGDGGAPSITVGLPSTGVSGLNVGDAGAPFVAAEGEVSTSVMRATQLVTETLRDADDGPGGNLRVTQAVTEIISIIRENVYLTQVRTEIVRFNPDAPSITTQPAKSWMVFRPEQSVEVILRSGTLASAANDLAVLNGENLALLGSELFQFRDVTDLGGEKYRLSYLLRGRFGTEWAMVRHRAGEPFILLEPGTFRRIAHVSTELNLTLYYKAVSFGMSLGMAVRRPFVDTGVSLKPYAPCYVRGSRDGSNNLTITWTRRARIQGDWLDYVDVPVGETTEAYEVDILNSSGTVVRTLTGLTAATASYTAALQTTDFGAPQAAIAIVVYQLSAIVGRGYGTSVVV